MKNWRACAYMYKLASAVNVSSLTVLCSLLPTWLLVARDNTPKSLTERLRRFAIQPQRQNAGQRPRYSLPNLEVRVLKFCFGKVRKVFRRLCGVRRPHKGRTSGQNLLVHTKDLNACRPLRLLSAHLLLVHQSSSACAIVLHVKNRIGLLGSYC